MSKFDFEAAKRRAERMQLEFPPGTRVKCLFMDDVNAVPNGTEGTVAFVDDVGTIHVDWDNGSGLGLTEADRFVKI